MLGFVLCAVIGFIFVGLGIYCFRAKKPVGFWANADVPKIEQVRSYNRSVGKLWVVYGIVFILLCLPMLGGQNSAGLIITILGVVFESIIAMVVYTVIIEPKYEKK